MRINISVFYNGEEEKELAIKFLEDKIDRAYFHFVPKHCIIKNANRYEHIFDNGDWWRVLPATESARGYRHSIAYYSSTIDKDVVNCIIRAKTIMYPEICQEVDLHDFM